MLRSVMERRLEGKVALVTGANQVRREGLAGPARADLTPQGPLRSGRAG